LTIALPLHILGRICTAISELPRATAMVLGADFIRVSLPPLCAALRYFVAVPLAILRGALQHLSAVILFILRGALLVAYLAVRCQPILVARVFVERTRVFWLSAPAAHFYIHALIISRLCYQVTD
jgi:hypothetical protein